MLRAAWTQPRHCLHCVLYCWNETGCVADDSESISYTYSNIIKILFLFQGTYTRPVLRHIASLFSFLHKRVKPISCQLAYFLHETDPSFK